VLRATKNGQLQDRTFRLRVTGADDPRWITPEGTLPVGSLLPLESDDAIFILDNEIIDYQLEVVDDDLLAGDDLIFYIEPGDGLLPPGITLTQDGKLTGVVEPLLAQDKIESRGGWDAVSYDAYPLDYAILSTSGWGSFFYDTQVFDFNFPTALPSKLNRYYEFAVTVADKVSDPVRRTFQIYVVGDDFIKDRQNGISELGLGYDQDEIAELLGGVFTADFTFIRTPVWITPPNLGFIRANNYATVYLDTLRSKTLAGVVTYSLQQQNPDGSASILPPGTELDSITGELLGYIPGQPAITTKYIFTILATRIGNSSGLNPSSARTFTIQVLGEIDSVITWVTPSNLGSLIADHVSVLQLEANTTVPDGRLLYRVTDGQLPYGLRLSYRGEIIGKATQESCNCSNFGAPGTFNFTVEAFDRFQFSASI
jgi:hypothetical protein